MINNEEIICKAIKSKEVLNIEYEDIWYRVEPHLMGFHITTTNVILSVYFPDAPYKEGKRQFWRFFTVSKIQNISNAGTIFVPRPDYDGNNQKISSTLCKIVI